MDDQRGEADLESDVVRSVLCQPEVIGLADELAELGVDRLIDVLVESEAADAIPVVKSIRAAFKGIVSVREAILTKNLLRFLVGVGEATADDVERWRSRVDKDAAQVGERLIALIDRVTSPLKATLIGHVFRSYLDGECERSTFLRTAEMIEQALTEDLKYLVDSRVSSDPSPEDEPPPVVRLISTGLMLDMANRLALEDSGPATPSAEGRLLQRAARRASQSDVEGPPPADGPSPRQT